MKDEEAQKEIEKQAQAKQSSMVVEENKDEQEDQEEQSEQSESEANDDELYGPS